MSDHVKTNKPLSILHTESSTGWGGQEIRILTEARGMLERGHRVMLLTPPDAEILPAAQRMGIPVQAIDILKKRVGPLMQLRQWLREFRHDYDVINTHSSTDSWLTAVACASLGQVPPIVRTRHVSTAVNNHASTRWLYTKATTHIVTTGEALRQQLHRDNHYALEHMTSVRTGIDLNYYQPISNTGLRQSLGVAERPTLGILATLRDWKGHNDLLDALVLLRSRFPAWQLLIIGDGPCRGRLEARTDALGLRDCVKFVGNCDNVPEWLGVLDLFVLPSFGDEGVPQSIMQAMACGLAVVSTPVGAIAEAVQDGSTGILVPPRHPQALAAALATLMDNLGQRAAMAQAGLKYAQINFGIERMLDGMESVFRKAQQWRY